MHTTLEYRTFDELLDSVKIDLKTYDLEGMIEGQELLKIAIRINRELGLKLNPNQQECIEIHDNKGRLPINFHVLNYALICEEKSSNVIVENSIRKTFMEDAAEMMLSMKEMLNSRQSLREESYTVTLNPGINIIKHSLKTTDIMVQVIDNETGGILNYEFGVANEGEVSILNDAIGAVENVRIMLIGRDLGNYSKGIAEISTDTEGYAIIKYLKSNRCVTYSHNAPIEIKNERTVNKIHHSHEASHYSAYLKSNFIHTNFSEGVVYLNYAGTMEDSDGNLLVLDHPFVNEYYEYSFKERIFENMFANGEATVLSRLQMYSQKIRAVKNNAFSYVNTPDFRVLKNIHDVNKRAMHHKYYNMFKS